MRQTFAKTLADLLTQARNIKHPVGTAKIERSPASLVDPTLFKVRGDANLNVAVTTATPTLIGGKTSAARKMGGENRPIL